MLTSISIVGTFLARFAVRVSIRLFAIVFVTSALVCLAPGFDSDDRQLDVRLDTQTILALRQSRSEQSNPVRAFVGYLGGVAHGDLGHSETFKRPVSELLWERSPVTLGLLGVGVACGWILAAVVASFGTLLRSRWLNGMGASLAGSLLCAPSVLLAFAAVVLRAPVAIAMGCIVFSRVFLGLHTFFGKTALESHVIAAEAMGMSRSALFTWHIVGVNIPQIVTLASGSIATALATVVPIEVISDAPGLGQLAWKATLGRDLPLLLSVTLLIALINTVVSVTTDTLIVHLRERTACQ
jgi:peptide/nickel transport system permease protein